MTDSEPKPAENPSETPVSAAPPDAASAAPVVPNTEAPASTDSATAVEPSDATPTARPGIHWGTGRRKAAVARVRLLPGSGLMLVNGREAEKFFTEPQDQRDVYAPLELTGVRRHWDVKVNVHGGGHSGQAGAIRLGVARALLKAYSQFETTLRDAGYLTRDARRVERKKPGQRKARRRFQFSKR